jgi:hypothetical protein
MGTLAGLVWLGGALWSRFAPQSQEPSPPPAPGEELARRKPGDSPEAGHATPLVAQPDTLAPAQEPVSWELQRDDILKSAATAEAKADRLLALLPQLSAAEQEDASRHLVNLLSDEHLLARGEACLTNLQISRAVQSALMADLLNRPEQVKLPLWLAILRTPEHPDAGEARNQLLFYVSEDAGTNWAAWESAIRERLQSRP